MNNSYPIPFRGVIWDMDGVLVDTGEFHFRSWNDALAKYHLSISREQFQHTFGMKNGLALAYLLGKEPPEEMVADIDTRKERRFRQLIRGQAKLLPGVAFWTDWFDSHGMPQTVASSAPPENIEALLGEVGLRACFHDVFSAQEIPGKPEPDVFLLAAGSLGLPPADCLVFEDSLAGVSAARRAGMHCVAVTTTQPAEALGEASLVVENLGLLTVDSLAALAPIGE